MHHPQASKYRMTLPREEGGWGIFELVRIDSPRKYCYEINNQIYNTIVEAYTRMTPPKLSNRKFLLIAYMKTDGQKNAEWNYIADSEMFISVRPLIKQHLYTG